MMLQRNDADPPRSDFEAWRGSFGSSVGAEYALECAEPEAFTGWVRPLNVFGFSAVDVACKNNRIERTQRNFRLDGADFYGVLFQVAGRAMVSHRGQSFHLAEGDIALIDKTRPASYAPDSEGARCLYIPFRRRSLISHFGFEPQGYRGRGGTLAARVLRQLVLDGIGDEESTAAPAGPHMRLALYDLLGALFAPSDLEPVSLHTDRLFDRICRVITDRCIDPDFGPAEVAAEMGISLRYVQKLCTARGCTCSELIYSIRLDHAARLLTRRTSHAKGQPLSEIAYACGFRDYTHFARRFRDRFGHPPGAHHEGGGAIGNRIARASAADCSRSAHNV
ncbi:MAG TPA: helix-turn-helix domain-containing protein [Bryobacteraceae bacterium]|nr:helix-turn-helix domain-containing protein [Bryobacteraceae bacterium]